MKERGKPVDLTGYVVKYEAISPYGNFVRDDAVVTNATGGVFEYTVSKEAVSSAGVWIGYFAFEKGTERFTTQDIRISLGRDVKQGNIAIEDYIAEFDKLKKQINALQVAVDKADVVKRSGGTMTGNLSLDRTDNTVTRDLRWTTGGSSDVYIGLDNAGLWRAYATGLGMIFSYNKDTKEFNVPGTTNLLKKTGDTMTGNLVMDNDKFVIFKDTSGVGIYGLKTTTTGALTLRDVKNGKDVFYASGNDFVVTADFKTKNDTTWTNLTLINGATVDAGNTPRYMRQGDVIYIVGAVTNVTDSMTIANLPVGIRPTSNCSFANSYLSTDLKKYAGEINVRTDGRITVDWMWNNVKSVSFCISYHL
ncbi:phage baseplate upper protein [Bacillus wiedmannii]|uniref:phage baseplate upper protein n=1 Tax=Bacillus wiedmannii TaxID=1890302 RepID=UPI00211D9A67|nr:phage baseplate upper protein [Bacillus wiedmannii]